jgi:Domain of unknown function (DUF5597)/Putative esterase
LFVPEHRFDPTVAAKAIYAIGHYNALGFSPFSIESTEKPSEEGLGKMYQLIESLTPLITSNQGKGKIEGVLLDKTNVETIVRMGKYEFTFKHEFTLGWSPVASAAEWPMAGAMLIQTGKDEFYLAGTGVVATFKPVSDPALNIGILKVDEGAFEQNQWKVLRHLNGDQTHQGRHVRIPMGLFNSQRVEMPAGHTPIMRFSMGAGADQDPFIQDLMKDIIPFVEQNYRVSPQREHRAIAGLSMVGVQTLNTALWYPEKFGYVYPMSTGYLPDAIKELEEKYASVLKNPAINQFKSLFWILIRAANG